MPKKEILNLNRTTKPVSDFEIEAASEEILSLLKEFESPKDAASALVLAHYKMIKDSFPPAYLKEAIEAVDASAQLIKNFLKEGWD